MIHDAEKNVLRERALRAEALVREKDETLGELLELVTCRGMHGDVQPIFPVERVWGA